MRVLVTGASGFIGYHVTKALLQQNHQVAILTLPHNPLTRLQPLRKRFETIAAMRNDPDLLEKSINLFNPEACIHLAWYAEPGKYLHSAENIRSLEFSLSLFQALIKAGCRQIVAAGTGYEYDNDHEKLVYLKENMPTRPTNLYAATKLSCCLIGSQLAAQAKISFAWGRIFNPYGLKEDPMRLVPGAITSLQQGIPFPTTPGTQIRDYIYASDVAAAFCILMEKHAAGVFNVSSGEPISVRQLLETLGQLMNRTDLIQIGALPHRSEEPPFYCGDNTKLRKLGWNPCYSLEQGLMETIKEI